MKSADPSLHSSSLILLSHLWLHEPGAAEIRLAVAELGLPVAEPAALAPAYADLLLLNVYPYGTAFTDDSGELNGPAARRLAMSYAAHGYHPPELDSTGAPDHLGLCLGFLHFLKQKRLDTRDFLLDLVAWAPVCCLAVERNPATHPFYRALAVATREWLLGELSKSPISNLRSMPSPRSISLAQAGEEEDVDLHDILRFFLTPARCGMFLSRAMLGQVANALSLRLPFGSRSDVAEMLFSAAGESGQTGRLLRLLSVETERWAAAYRAWSARPSCPAWQPFAVQWLERIDAAQQTLAGMRQALERLPESESHEAASAGRVP